MRYGLEEQEWSAVFATFARFNHIEKAILYGSRAKGTQKPFSDVDITLVGQALTYDELIQVKGLIDDLLLPYEFDISLFSTLQNQALKEHILRRGICVYERPAH